MLGWPHSGFGAYVGARIEEREGVLRVAHYSARAPVTESRLRYDPGRAEVERVSDRSEGPYAGVHRRGWAAEVACSSMHLRRWTSTMPTASAVVHTASTRSAP